MGNFVGIKKIPRQYMCFYQVISNRPGKSRKLSVASRTDVMANIEDRSIQSHDLFSIVALRTVERVP